MTEPIFDTRESKIEDCNDSLRKSSRTAQCARCAMLNDYVYAAQTLIYERFASHQQVGKAPSWARATIGADSHDGFCIMHNIIYSQQLRNGLKWLAGSSSFVAPS